MLTQWEERPEKEGEKRGKKGWERTKKI